MSNSAKQELPTPDSCLQTGTELTLRNVLSACSVGTPAPDATNQSIPMVDGYHTGVHGSDVSFANHYGAANVQTSDHAGALLASYPEYSDSAASQCISPPAEYASSSSSSQPFAPIIPVNNNSLSMMQSAQGLLNAASVARIYSLGYVTLTFGQLPAKEYFATLLKCSVEIHNSPSHFPVPYLPWASSVVQGLSLVPNYLHQHAHVVNGTPMLVLDHAINLQLGLVVPQGIWQPPSETMRKNLVEQARLHLPIFFVHESGAVGVTLSDTVHGNWGNLRGLNDPVSMGSQTSRKLRIQASFGTHV